MSPSPVTLSVLLKSLCDNWKRRAIPCRCAVFSLANSEYWHRKNLPEVFIAGQYPVGRWQQSCRAGDRKATFLKVCWWTEVSELWIHRSGCCQFIFCDFPFFIFFFWHSGDEALLYTTNLWQWTREIRIHRDIGHTKKMSEKLKWQGWVDSLLLLSDSTLAGELGSWRHGKIKYVLTMSR